MRVKVIVLSYNGTADTLRCLESLERQASGNFDILVVDNASSDGAPDAIRARFPELALMELSENLGWAGGNNAGIRRAIDEGADLICLLNNDTFIPAGAIAQLTRCADLHAPCLMHPAIDFADPAEGAQLDPSKWRVMPHGCRALGDDLYELNFAYGACLMVSAEVFKRVGLLDERLFLQLEETDLFHRAQRAGFRVFCTTKARIIHSESRSFGARMSPTKIYYIVRNSLLLIEKHHRNPHAAWLALRKLYWTVSRATRTEDRIESRISPLAWPLSRHPLLVASRAGLRDYLWRTFGRMPSSIARKITQHDNS